MSPLSYRSKGVVVSLATEIATKPLEIVQHHVTADSMLGERAFRTSSVCGTDNDVF